MSQNIDSSGQIHQRTGIVTSAGIALNANENRRLLIIQNLGTNTLYVKFGEGASTTSFDVILKGGTASDDGLGGILTYDTLSYTGVISVDGTSPRFTATDF